MVQRSWEHVQEVIVDLCKGHEDYVDVLTAYEFFGNYIWDEFERVNQEYRGMSVKCRQSGTLLVVRAVWDGESVVSFVQGVNLSDCLRIFTKWWFAGEIRWTLDKFA